MTARHFGGGPFCFADGFAIIFIGYGQARLNELAAAESPHDEKACLSR
jgi:hypothetical protein